MQTVSKNELEALMLAGIRRAVPAATNVESIFVWSRDGGDWGFGAMTTGPEMSPLAEIEAVAERLRQHYSLRAA